MNHDPRILKPLVAIVAILLSLAVPAAVGRAQPITEASPEQLRRWLREYPNADADGDGVLTVGEAEAYRRKLAREPLRAVQAPGFHHEFTVFTASDGVSIALAVGYPPEFDPADADRKWPAIFRTSGYTGATVPMHPAEFADRYVTVSASIRGTGVSGGQLSPWRPRTWQDGHEVIEQWIVRQPWSSGRVGIIGHSWPGLMGFLTATTRPPSLRAVCVSGLIDDFYRGIAYPGGIRNCGFPVDWLNSYYRSDGPFGSDAAALTVRGLNQSDYAAVLAARPHRDLTADMLWLVLHEPLDGPKWREQNLGSYAGQIRAPILLGHTWQDEQTGPSGWRLFQRVPDNVPKRIAMGNGHHAVRPFPDQDPLAWFDHWLLDIPDPKIAEAPRRVECYFETHASDGWRASPDSLPLTADHFPLPDTQWTRCYLRAGGKLSLAPPEEAEIPGEYRVTHANLVAETSQAVYRFEVSEPTAILGPLVLTLWASLSTVDTDFFVLLADEAPDGTLFGLQRGLLRASHRAVDREGSDYAEAGGARLLVRPRHPHTQAVPVPPHEPCEYLIAVPAVGHVFRPGHKLALVIGRPPADDPIGMTRSGAPSYRYQSSPPPGRVTIHHGPDHSSHLLLPVLPQLPPLPANPVPVGSQAGLQPILRNEPEKR